MEDLVNELRDLARPGILISNTWPTSRERRGDTLAAIQTVLEAGFFEAFQTVEIPYADERRQIAGLLGAEKLPLTYCLARVLNENGMNLSDLDEANRRRSYEHAIRCLDDAREAGATAVSVISGPRPADPGRREEAVKRLGDSLVRICRAAQAGPALQIVAEPLDVEAHKRCSLGLTHEAVDLCVQAKQAGLDLWLCLDTAHMLLNREGPMDALALAQPYVAEFHYCNCVTDPSHPLFGDRHLHFGPPGIVDVAAIGRFMQRSVDIAFFDPEARPRIYCEVLKRDQDDPLQVMRHCRDALERAWSLQAASRREQE